MIKFFVSFLCAVGALSAATQDIVPMPAQYRKGTERVDTTRAKRVVYVEDPSVPQEGYRLGVTPTGTVVWASGQAGRFYAQKTLEQLIEGADQKGRISAVEITDAPRYGYRGIMLDPARHFLPLGDLKRVVDAMARYKLNKLHLHLSDDQGWRVEIKAYPRLTQIGSVRKETDGNGVEHKGFYTQDELRELVAYAAARQVEVFPEIDLPGHSVSAVAAYPELSCRGEQVAVRTTPGVSLDLLCAGNDRVVGFYQTVIGELADIFLSKRFHLGGDEAPTDRWDECPKCQARKKEHGLASNQELMSWFFGQMNRVLASVGKEPMFWYELDVPHYPKGATMYTWRWGLTPKAIETCTAQGYPLVMTPGEHAYFDYPQYKGEVNSGPLITFEKAYALNPPQNKVIIGVEATLWGEFIPTIDTVFVRMFPRAMALSEAGWSVPERRQWSDFLRRAGLQKPWLDRQGIGYRNF